MLLSIFLSDLALKLPVTSKMTGPQVGRMVLLARVAAIPLRLSRADLSAFLLVVMFSDGGNYGLPVVLFVFGSEAPSHATVYFVTSSILTYTVGVSLGAAGRRSVPRALLGIIHRSFERCGAPDDGSDTRDAA